MHKDNTYRVRVNADCSRAPFIRRGLGCMNRHGLTSAHKDKNPKKGIGIEGRSQG